MKPVQGRVRCIKVGGIVGAREGSAVGLTVVGIEVVGVEVGKLLGTIVGLAEGKTVVGAVGV